MIRPDTPNKIEYNMTQFEIDLNINRFELCGLITIIKSENVKMIPSLMLLRRDQWLTHSVHLQPRFWKRNQSTS